VSEVDDLPIFNTKKEIRRMLHPEGNADEMPKHGNVLSGTNLSLTKQGFQAYKRSKKSSRQLESPDVTQV
jgi:hypothetical protein